MADTGDGVVPAEGVSGQGGGHGSPLSFLNGEWINERLANVSSRINGLLDRLIDDGLLGSGYPPFETPITDDMLSKMTPQEFRTLYDTMTDLASRSELLARVKALKLPPMELMPFAPKAHYPAPAPVAGTVHPPVSSSESVG